MKTKSTRRTRAARSRAAPNVAARSHRKTQEGAAISVKPRAAVSAKTNGNLSNRGADAVFRAEEAMVGTAGQLGLAVINVCQTIVRFTFLAANKAYSDVNGSPAPLSKNHSVYEEAIEQVR